MSIKQKPWFEWMEDAVSKIYDNDVESMALVAQMKDGDTLTAYYEASQEERAAMIYHMLADMVLDVVKINANIIKEYLDDCEC